MQMAIKAGTAKSIDEYIAHFPEATQNALQEVRATIQKAAPGAEETISYAIPTFNHSGTYLVYFAGYKNHIGLYPVPTGNVAFESEFSSYKTSGKGAIQFPLSEPMPVHLITKIVKFRLQEQSKNASAKGLKKTMKR
jgi:uncharacterized protein YdhG (YjbR/CyaY superfamily)